MTARERWSIGCAALVVVLGSGRVILAGITPEQKCAAVKVKAAGLKVYAKTKCYQKAILKGADVDPLCLDKVETKFTAAIARADGLGTCTGTVSALEMLVDTCVGNLVASTTTTTTSAPATTTTSAPATTTTLVSGCFTDTGDGTIHDTCTGLQWEKKTNTAGLQNVNTRYTWAGCCNGDCSTSENYCQPNAGAAATCTAQASGGTRGCSVCASGTCNVDPYSVGVSTTVWDWLNQVNAANFAGRSDWRLPSEGGCNSCSWGAPNYTCASCNPHELETILLAPYFCGTSPCINSIFGPTAAYIYWSATTYAASPNGAWDVVFFNGRVTLHNKNDDFYVRAVRGGL